MEADIREEGSLYLQRPTLKKIRELKNKYLNNMPWGFGKKRASQNPKEIISGCKLIKYKQTNKK